MRLANTCVKTLRQHIRDGENIANIAFSQGADSVVPAVPHNELQGQQSNEEYCCANSPSADGAPRFSSPREDFDLSSLMLRVPQQWCQQWSGLRLSPVAACAARRTKHNLTCRCGHGGSAEHSVLSPASSSVGLRPAHVPGHLGAVDVCKQGMVNAVATPLSLSVPLLQV